MTESARVREERAPGPPKPTADIGRTCASAVITPAPWVTLPTTLVT